MSGFQEPPAKSLFLQALFNVFKMLDDDIFVGNDVLNFLQLTLLNECLWARDE